MRLPLVVAAAALLTGTAEQAVKAEDHAAIVQAMIDKRNEHILEVMTTKLSLNQNQETTVKSTLDSQSKKMMDLQNEFADRKKAIQDDADAQISAVLTEDQKSKYPDVKADLQKEDAQQLGQHWGGGQSGSSSGGGGGGGGGRHGGRHGGMGGGF